MHPVPLLRGPPGPKHGNRRAVCCSLVLPATGHVPAEANPGAAWLSIDQRKRFSRGPIHLWLLAQGWLAWQLSPICHLLLNQATPPFGNPRAVADPYFSSLPVRAAFRIRC